MSVDARLGQARVMKDTLSAAMRRDAGASGRTARRLAALALVVLVFAAVLFGGAWVLGGEDAVSDNWVGVTVVVAFFVGLFGALAAMLTAGFAGLRHEPWSRVWVPLATFPAVVVIVGLLEAFVFE